jgi:hypothetical protein
MHAQVRIVTRCGDEIREAEEHGAPPASSIGHCKPNLARRRMAVTSCAAPLRPAHRPKTAKTFAAVPVAAMPRAMAATVLVAASARSSLRAMTRIPLRFAQDAATFTNPSSSSGSRAVWSIWAKLTVDVEPLLDQLDFTDGRQFVGDPLLNLARRLTRAARLFAGTWEPAAPPGRRRPWRFQLAVRLAVAVAVALRSGERDSKGLPPGDDRDLAHRIGGRGEHSHQREAGLVVGGALAIRVGHHHLALGAEDDLFDGVGEVALFDRGGRRTAPPR